MSMPSGFKTFVKSWGAIFAFLICLLGALIRFIPVETTKLNATLFILGCAAVASLVAWRRFRRIHLPVDYIAPCEIKPDDQAVLCCPCNSAISKEANDLASRYYGNESIPFDRFEQWRLKNPNILVCLLDSKGDVVGYFDVLPLRSTFFDPFIVGKITERHLGHEDILPPGKAHRCNRLYLSGIAVRDPATFLGHRYASILVWGLFRYLEHFYPPVRTRNLFALAATREGEQLLRKFNFRIATPGTAREDGHNLYMFSLNSSSLSEILSSMPSWENLCRLVWQKQSDADKKIGGGQR